MTTAVIVMGGLGCLVGLCLSVAASVFHVDPDPETEDLTGVLPGINCGGCGLPGCVANARAILAGSSSPFSCLTGGPELPGAIAGLLWPAAETGKMETAEPGCAYGAAEAGQKYIYAGIPDCRAAALLSGGMNACDIGCLGLGTCVRVCLFNALRMNERGLPEVDREKCTGCGACERVCPKHIIKLSSVTRRILAEATADDCTAPCQRACPAGVDIREYIRHIAGGDYARAMAVIKERVPFPAVIGRICPGFCESKCRRNLIDEPVAINALKRFAADYEKEKGRVLPLMAPATRRKVAIIGGGIEGLSAAYFAARLGHSSLVLEASGKPGGPLRKIVSPERLPEDILDDDINGLRDMGIKIMVNQVSGRNFTVDALLADNFETVFLAAGEWDHQPEADNRATAGTPVRHLYLLRDLLRGDKIPVGNRVVMIGGGSLAATAVALCRRAGAGHVTLLLPEKDAQAAGLDETLFQAGDIDIAFQAGLERIHGTGRTIEEIAYDVQPGRTICRIPADTIFFADRKFPELIFIRKRDETETDEVRIFDPDAPVTDPIPWVAMPPYQSPLFDGQAGRSAENTPGYIMAAAVNAIDTGRRAAVSMHRLLNGEPLSLPGTVLTRHSVIQTVSALDNVSPCPRNPVPRRSAAEIARGMEAESAFSERTARDEAARCLQCGITCYKHG